MLTSSSHLCDEGHLKRVEVGKREEIKKPETNPNSEEKEKRRKRKKGGKAKTAEKEEKRKSWR